LSLAGSGNPSEKDCAECPRYKCLHGFSVVV
jgi:hypothetical protein